MSLEKKAFYVYLSSDGNADLYPNNVHSSFKNRLEKPVQLDSRFQWVVGLAEILIPSGSQFTSRSAASRPSRPPPPIPQPTPFTTVRSAASPSPATSTPPASTTPATPTVLDIKARSYTSLSEFYDVNIGSRPDASTRSKLRELYYWAVLEEYVSPPTSHNVNPPATVACQIAYTTASNKKINIKFTKDYYAESLLWLQDGHANTDEESWNQFSEDFQKLLAEKEKSETGQTFQGSARRRRRRQTAATINGGPMYLYLDILSPIRVSDTYSKLLRILNPGSNSYIFTEKYYLSVGTTQFSEISFAILNRQGERYPLPGGSAGVIVVLHFMPVGEKTI